MGMDALQEVMCDDVVVGDGLNALREDAATVLLEFDGSKNFNVDSLAPLSLLSVVEVRHASLGLVDPELDLASCSTVVQLEGEVGAGCVGSKLLNLTNDADLSDLSAVNVELVFVLSGLTSLELLQCDGDDRVVLLTGLAIVTTGSTDESSSLSESRKGRRKGETERRSGNVNRARNGREESRRKRFRLGGVGSRYFVPL